MNKKQIQKETERYNLWIKLLNFYYANTSQIFRYGLLMLALLLAIFFIYILLPEDTRNGVDDTYVNKVDYQQNLENAFIINDIPQNFTFEQAKKYTHQIVDYIKKNDGNQYVYMQTIVFLNKTCSKNVNKNTDFLYQNVLTLMQSPEMQSKLDSNNIVLKSNLEFCKKDTLTKIEEEYQNESEIMVALMKEKVKTENELDNLLSKREFNKRVYGDVYDEKTGKMLYAEKTVEQIKAEEEEERYRLGLVKKLEEIEFNIEKLNLNKEKR